MSSEVATWLRRSAAVAALASAACQLPDTSVRGFDSRQILAVRDDAVRLGPFSIDNSHIYRMRLLSDVAVPDGAKPPYDLSLFDLDSHDEVLVAPGVLLTQKLPARIPSQPGDDRFLALMHFASDADIPAALVPNMVPPVLLTFLDEVTGSALDLNSVDSQRLQLGASRTDPILMGRLGADRTSSLWFGKPEALMALPAGVNNVVGLDRGGVVGLTSSPAGGTQQFVRYPFDGSASIPLVSGVPSEYVVVTGGDDPETAASPPVLPGGGVSPRIFCPPRASSDPPAVCSLFYDRVGTDMTSFGFVRLLDGAGEMQLPGTLLGHLGDVAQVAPDGHNMFWPAISSTKQTRIFSWQLGDPDAASCVVALSPALATFRISAWRPGTGQFVVIAQPPSQTDISPGSWTAVAGTAGKECHVIATGANLIKQLIYSPDGSRLAFLETDAKGASKVYVANADAPDPQLAVEGMLFTSIDFHDARHLLLWRWTLGSYSLSWIDVSSTPSVDHPIADGAVWEARDSWAWLDDQSVVIADSALPEDGTCSLHLVNIETGLRRLVSQGVADFGVSWNKRPDDARELAIAYVVRSREASSQDGLWLARVGLDEFPVSPP